MSDSIDLRNIGYGINIRSKPVRENFSDIETNFNLLRAETANLDNSESASEFANASDDFLNTYEWMRKCAELDGNGVILDKKTVYSCDYIDLISANVDDIPAGQVAPVEPARNTDNYIRGNGSVEMALSGTAAGIFSYDFDMGNITLDNDYLIANVYIPNHESYDSIVSGTIYLSPRADYEDYRVFNFPATDFKQGWNELKCIWNNPDETVGIIEDDEVLLVGRVGFDVSTDFDITDDPADIMLLDDIHTFGTDLRVIEKSTPSMEVQVLPGSGVVDGYGLNLTAATDSSTMVAPSANPRYDAIRLNSSGISIVTGAEAATPIPPENVDDKITLAWVYHRVAETQINTYDDGTHGYIIDRREIVNFDHTYKGNLIDIQNEVYYNENTSTVALTGSYVNGLTVTFKPTATDTQYICKWDFDAYIGGASPGQDIMYKIERLENVTWSTVGSEMFGVAYTSSSRYYHFSGSIIYRNAALTGLEFGYRIVFKYLTAGGSIKNQHILIRRVE